MLRTSPWVLAACILLTMSSTNASWAEWTQITDEEARIHLRGHGALGEVWSQDYINGGHDYHCQVAWWGWAAGPYGIEVKFCWTDDPRGWHRDHLTGGKFVNWFKGTKDIGGGDLTRSEELESAIGTLGTMLFELDSYDGCIGFIQPWMQRQGNKRHLYARVLAVYGCGREGNVISADALRSVLRGLTADGEFEALFE